MKILKTPVQASKGLWRCLEALGGPGDPWMEVYGGPPAAARLPILFLSRKREGDLFEVGIEGVALNPNRK